jgi:hypothetical protein
MPRPAAGGSYVIGKQWPVRRDVDGGGVLVGQAATL